MAPTKQQISQFRDLTGASEKVATTYLSRFNNSIDRAADAYFAENDTSSGSSSASSATASSASSATFNASALPALFNQYAGTTDADKDLMCDEKMAQFFEAIGIDAQSPVSLLVAWTCNCANYGEITRDEFVAGFTKLRASNLAAIKTAVARLHQQTVADRASFRTFYRWLFDFLKEERERKVIDAGAAIEMWSLVFHPQFVPWPLLDSWLAFCKQHTKLKVIPKDLWDQLLEFARDVAPTLTNFDEDGAWPVAIDEFIEYVRKKNAKK